MRIRKYYLLMAILIALINLTSQMVSAVEWQYGSAHVHTGYSTQWGYDGNPFTFVDNCRPILLEGHVKGYKVEELKEGALDKNLHWLAFSDHSYCIDSSEFNTVKSDCQNSEDSGFSCLWGEEISAAEIVDDTEFLYGCDVFGGDNGEAHLGAYGIDTFISQSPAATHCPDTPDVQNAINSINQNGVSTINHPYTFGGVLDFESINAVSGETGIEIWNSDWDSYDQDARNTWVWDKLQEGEKVYAYGSTDSHGEASTVNYNLVKMDSLTHSGLEDGLKSGTNVVSNNGYVAIFAKTNTQGSWTDMGGELDAYTGETLTLRIDYNVVNSCTLTARRSEIGSLKEDYYTYSISGSDIFYLPYSLTDTGDYYFRAECISPSGAYRIYTNPIWVHVYTGAGELCYDGIDNDNDGLTDCADTSDCSTGTPSQSGFCCSGTDASKSGFTCSDGNCNAYGEACQNGELESGLVCSGTSLSCSGGSCEYGFGVPSSCDEKTPGDAICEAGGSFNERACEVTGTDCYLEAENQCSAPGGCDEKSQNACSSNSGLQCEWQGAGDNVVEECDTSCGAISQCSEQQPGYDYASCMTSGQTYFADQCSSSCQGEDRGDNICRSSTFAAGCTAAANCNGLSTGTDLNSCNQVGQPYYEDECSSSCQYSDVTSVFECGETGCSCSEPLCDGGTTGTDILTCASGQTYFADECTSTASGQDRGDNVCRSSTFAGSCTADAQCDGVTAGTSIETGSCSSTCVFDAFPNVTLVSPIDGNISTTGNAVFNCSATDDKGLVNITLYHNISGSWQSNETKALTGTEDSETFEINNIPNDITFVWNCLASDTISQSSWADSNYSSTINISSLNITISSLSEVFSSGNDKVFEMVILNNGEVQLNNVTWALDFGDGTLINSTYNASLLVGEIMPVYLAYNYANQNDYVVNATAWGIVEESTLTSLASISLNPDLNVSDLSVINESGTSRTFEFIATNLLTTALSDVSWSFDTDNSFVFNNNINTSLIANESFFVFIDYDYGTTGNFNVIASARNNSISDNEVLNIDIN